eukprot:1765734-Pyramimonas_sp.AAC.1
MPGRFLRDVGLVSLVPRPAAGPGFAVRRGGGLPRHGRGVGLPESHYFVAARRPEGPPGVRFPVSGSEARLLFASSLAGS